MNKEVKVSWIHIVAFPEGQYIGKRSCAKAGVEDIVQDLLNTYEYVNFLFKERWING